MCNKLVLVAEKSLLENVLKELGNVVINRDVNKIEESEITVLVYSRSFCVGYDWSFVSNLKYVGFKADFFKTPEWKQLNGRFNRYNRKIPLSIEF